MNSPRRSCPLRIAQIYASFPSIFLLVILGNVFVGDSTAYSAPRLHHNASITDSESGDSTAHVIDSQISVSATESRSLMRKAWSVKSNMTCVSLSNDLFYTKPAPKQCKRRKKSPTASSRLALDASKTGLESQSKVPHWLMLVQKKHRGAAALLTAVSEHETLLNASHASSLNASCVSDVNISAPEEGKVEERKPSMNLEKVRMDVLGRLEDEQHQHQQQAVHGSVNRSSSIPLIHRSTEEASSKGVNYASAALGAKIVSSNAEGKHAIALLLSEEERYWMSPCSANRSVVIELAESVLVQSITLMHNEYYSSISRAVLLQGAQIMPTDRWITLGLLAVENIRGAQSYSIPSSVELRYLSLQMHGSYGKETFCTMSGVQVFGKAAMGIIEQEIDREAHLAMRSYADVQAEILKSLEPNPAPATAAVVVAPVEPTDPIEAKEIDFADLPLPTTTRFQWGKCVVCVDLCRAPPSVVAALASEISGQQAHNAASRTIGSVNMSTPSAHNSSAEGIEKYRQDETSAASVPSKSVPSSGTSIVGSLSVAAPGEDSQHVPSTSSAGAGEAVITKDVVSSAVAGATAIRGDVDTPKIQLDSNIIRKLWNKLRDLEFNHSVVSGFVNVLSKKHEEQLSQLTISTANLDLSLHAIRNSSACQCPDVTVLERSLDAAAARIAQLEAATSRITELEAAVARLLVVESRVSQLLALAALPSDDPPQ